MFWFFKFSLEIRWTGNKGTSFLFGCSNPRRAGGMEPATFSRDIPFFSSGLMGLVPCRHGCLWLLSFCQCYLY